MKQIEDRTLWALVSGDLDKGEAERLEELIKTDKELERRCVEMRTILLGVKEWAVRGDRTRFSRIIQNVNRDERRWRWIIFSVFFILAIVLYMMFSGESSSPPASEELFAEHFAPMSLPGVSRSIDTYSFQDTIHALYAQGDYKGVLRTSSGRDHDLSEKAVLSVAISAIQESEWDRAEMNLNRLMRSDDTLLRDHVEWYLLLLELARGGEVPLEDLSRMSADLGHDRCKEAQKLLNALK